MPVPDSILKKAAAVTCLAAILGVTCPEPGLTQTEYWDTEARKSSQNLSSSALNHLKNIYAGKKKRKGRKGDLKEAIQLLERAISKDPTDPLPHYLLGIALSIDGRYGKALPALQKANKLDPDENEILLGTGLAQYLSGNYKRAGSIFQKLESRMKRKAPVHVLLGYTNLRLGKLEDAIENFSRAQELEPGLHSAQEGMTRVYYLAGDLDQAMKTADHAQSIKEYPPVSLIQADIYRLKGDSRSCQKLLKSWKKLTRKYVPHKSMTELGFSSQHDFEWDPFSVDDPDSDLSIKAREYILEKPKKSSSLARKLSSRLSLLDKRLGECDEDFYLYHGKGVLATASNDLKTAENALDRSMKLCPENRLDLLNLAIVKLAAGDSAGASALMKKYRAVYPDTKLIAPLEQLKESAPEAVPEKKPVAKPASTKTREPDDPF